MKSFKFLCLPFYFIACIACQQPVRPEPVLPLNVRNWERHTQRGVTVIGDFLLKRGETTNNGSLQVELIDLISGDLATDPHDDAHRTKATIRFIRFSDRKILCEGRFVEKSSTPISITQCKNHLSDFGVLSVYVDAINLTDGWAHFQLLN